MNSILLYLIKSTFYGAAFYVVYYCLLGKDTLYSRNRAFILVSIISAMILPFITIHTKQQVNIGLFGKTLSEVLVRGSSGAVSGSDPETAWDLPKVLTYIYISGILIFSIKLLFDTIELIFLIVGSKEKGSNIIRFHGLNTSGFSAFGYLFIRKELNPEEAEEIIKHEKYHIDKYHFIDIIFIEIARIIQWFNPFIHLFNKSLRAVHEYQADEGCLKAGVPVTSYQKLIMNQLFHTNAFMLTNSFSSPTLIKKRMIMMTKKRSPMLANLKLLLVLPVVAIVMIAFSSCKGKTTPAKNTNEEIAPPPPPPVPVVSIDNQKVPVGYVPKPGEIAPPPPPPPPPVPYKVVNGDTVWMVVDQMPQFHGGDAGLLKFIGDSTKYPEIAKKNNIQGRVIVAFTVTEKGVVTNPKVLKGVDPLLDKEAVRVVNLLTFEKPGINKGKPVPVQYIVPITYTLK